MNDDRLLWRPEAQGRDAELVAKEAAEGIAREWERVWELPLPYYREKFEAAGLGPEVVPSLDEVPRTVKDDLREDERRNPPFGTHRAVGLDDAVRLGASTGTSGKPTLFFYGPTDLAEHIESGIRSLWRYGVRPGDRFTHSWPQGLYPTGVSGGRTYLDIGVLEIAVGLPFSPEAAQEHVQLWELTEPDGFMLTASQLETYLQAAERVGVDLPRLLNGAKVALLEPSCQFEGPRRRFEQAYGFRQHNLGGASEVPGFSVSDCGYHSGLHVRGDHFVVQACDPETGREVPEGQRGTLVITAFGLDAFAFRYDIQDIVTVASGACSCGETGPRFTYLGRAADGARVNGDLLLPIDIQLALDALEWPPEFRIQTAAQDALDLEVETQDAATVTELLQSALGVPVRVTPVEVGSLPRASFKPRRVAS